MENLWKKLDKILPIISLAICAINFIVVNVISSKKIYQDTEHYILFVLLYIYFSPGIYASIVSIITRYINYCLLVSYIIIALDDIAIFILFLVIYNSPDHYTGTHILFIFSLINIIIDIISLIKFKKRVQEYNKNRCGGNAELPLGDCLDHYFEEKEKKNWEQSTNQINAINKQNNYLNEENEKLVVFNKKNNKLNVEEKKIEVILWYVKNKYNKIFSPNILHQYLLDEIKDKCGLIIDKYKFQNIFLNYIKENFAENLTCPLTADIFNNPVITPEGQTFDKNYLLKEIKLKGQNPLTRNKLEEEKLIVNKLVLDLCEILKFHYDEFKMEHFLEMRKLLINPRKKTLYTNPFVISEGSSKGETDDGIGEITQYSNKVILNIIEQNKEVLSDDFVKDISGNNGLNNLFNFEDNLNSDARLNIK